MALTFVEPTVCYNSSILLERVCNNHGTCANKTDAECVCEGQYVKENSCLTTISEELNNANFPFYVIIAIAFFLLIVMTLYDFIIDIRLKAWPSSKRPIAVGKITLFLASLAIFIHAVIDYAEHSANTKDFRDVKETLRFFSDFLTLMTYSIAALSWISVILKAKGLGKEMKGLAVYRRYVLVANLILLPIYFISNVLVLIFDESDLLVLINAGVALLVFMFYLSLIVGTSVFIWKAFVWIRSLEISRRTPTTERVKLKTYFLVGANIIASVRFVFWMIGLSSGNTSTKIHLYLLIVKTSQSVFFLFLLLILENHIVRLPLYIRTGEIRSNTFLAGSGSTRPSATTQSMASSKRRKSTTDSTRDASSIAQADALNPSREASLKSDAEGEGEEPGKTEEQDAEALLGLSSSAPPSSSSGSFEASSGSTSGYYSTTSSGTSISGSF
eukprot:TRINITY_DN1388_c0_g1_i1.p1 TRINITY_DN1388_c0_g1~~TRINITY_DN1388_c0_g1_i1.p1  ORF type:complete len:452 (+),score=66.14 TRINITY_DN1388_c0_g1_i1:26-1357(+)